MNTLKLPISFNFDGSMETIAEGSDAYYATILANAIQTEKGEYPISTLYGIDDPVFSGKSINRLFEEVSAYVPEINVENVSIKRATDDGDVDVSIRFNRSN